MDATTTLTVVLGAILIVASCVLGAFLHFIDHGGDTRDDLPL